MGSINLQRGSGIESAVLFNGPWCLYDFISAEENRRIHSCTAGLRSQFSVQQVESMAVSISHAFKFFPLAAGTLAVLFAIMSKLSWLGSSCEVVFAAVVWCSIFKYFFTWFLCHPALFLSLQSRSLAFTSVPTAPQLTTPFNQNRKLWCDLHIYIYTYKIFIYSFNLNELWLSQLEMLPRCTGFQNQRKKTKWWLG